MTVIKNTKIYNLKIQIMDFWNEFSKNNNLMEIKKMMLILFDYLIKNNC